MPHVPPLLSQKKAEEIEWRFWEKVDVRTIEECWPWKAARVRGYGSIFAWGRPQGAHRIAYALLRGDVALGLHVLHRCDNPACCNPAHMFLGTNADNMRDRFAKGRVRVKVAA